jgi:hypothetical protein
MSVFALTLAGVVAGNVTAPHFITPGMDFVQAVQLLREPSERDCRLPTDPDVRWYRFTHTGVTLRVGHVAVGYRVREVRWDSPRPGFGVEAGPPDRCGRD